MPKGIREKQRVANEVRAWSCFTGCDSLRLWARLLVLKRRITVIRLVKNLAKITILCY